MAAQPESQKHPCEYCGQKIGSGAYQHILKHKRNGDMLTLKDGINGAVRTGLQRALQSAKLELTNTQTKIESLAHLRHEEERLTHLVTGLESALSEYEKGETKDAAS